MLIFMQKYTTFINTSCFSFDLEPTLLYSYGLFKALIYIVGDSEFFNDTYLFQS